MSEAISKTEFQNWFEIAQTTGWVFDQVTFHNRGEILMHTPGRNGVYLEVNGLTADIGFFEDAYQYITDGTFRSLYCRKFDTGTPFAVMLDVLKKLNLPHALAAVYAS